MWGKADEIMQLKMKVVSQAEVAEAFNLITQEVDADIFLRV